MKEANSNDNYDAQTLLLNDSNGNELFCYLEQLVSVEGQEYALLTPVDTPVSLFKINEKDEPELIEKIDNNEQLLKNAEAVLQEHDLRLIRSAVTLSVSGELEEPIYDELEEDYVDDDSESYELLVNFNLFDQEYGLYIPLDPFFIVGKLKDKGALLVGPPGTGKTLLARAIAGEAGVPFFTISGSDFVEMFVGVGASRVRDMFEQGKKNSPCIIFIDEIDAVGRSRGAGLGGGNDEREQTLNQLLVEMDGFDTNEGIILIAASSWPDVLDPALLRPGRFDRQVVVSNPDIIGREKILKVHVKKIKMAPDVNLRTIARGTPGFSGADLANLVNESALLAARKNKRIVTLNEFEEAKDKVMMGAERRSMVMTEDEKKLTAYHEGGHALVSFNMPSYDPIHKATIIPRGRALGMVMNLPERDKHGHSIKYLKARLAVCFGGRVAEEVIFGKDNISTGAGGGSGSDINQATQLARAMVTKYGMSEEMGPVEYGENQEEVFLGRSVTQTQSVSEEVAQKIDKEIRKLVDEGYNKAKEILTEKIDDLHKIAKALMTYETLTGEEIENIITKNIYPADKQDLKVDDDKSSALGAMGLKPKIVH